MSSALMRAARFARPAPPGSAAAMASNANKWPALPQPAGDLAVPRPTLAWSKGRDPAEETKQDGD